jgi:nitrogen fixation/metabolism regulation signal transduction histidine kinase
MSKNKRKQILIDPTAQLALARNMFTNWLCFLAVVILLAVCVEIVVQYPDQSLQSLTQGAWHRHAQTITLMLLICPFFIYRSIKLSHRFAGPIWRLRREMRRLNEGNTIEPLHFRKNDFWKDLAEDFNGMLQRLERAEQRQVGTAELVEANRS